MTASFARQYFPLGQAATGDLQGTSGGGLWDRQGMEGENDS